MTSTKTTLYLTGDGAGYAAADGTILAFVSEGFFLVTDRTLDDVQRVGYLARLWSGGVFSGTTEELAEWFGNPKGAYNASDLNRVGNAVAYVAGRLAANGYAVEVSPKTDWTAKDIPTPAQMQAYLAEVAELRQVIAVLPTTPEVPGDMEGFTYGEANNIEQILIDIDALLTKMTLAWFYSGELYSGEV